jgi:signal transduction histidine kinase
MDGSVNLAYDYPVLGAFWTVLWIFLWVIWMVLLFRAVADVFRDRELSGMAKAAWLLFMIVVPFFGVLTYVAVRGRNMAKREALVAEERQREQDKMIREIAAGANGGHEIEQLAKLSDLKSRGDISESEFQQAKEKILH